jgi:protein SCO1
MRRTIRTGFAPLLAAAVVTAGLAVFGSVRTAADNSRWGANYFPNVTLTTQDGTKVRFYDDLLNGKIVAIDLIYTTCKYACPLETARLAQVQALLGDRMGKDVFFYSITIDPDHDTPPVLKAYAEKFHAGPGWLFLTGKAEDIELISRKLGIYSEPDPANKDGHTPSLIVGNEATGQWMRNSALDNARFLARTIGDWMNSWKTSKPGRSYADAKPLTLDPGQYAFSTHCAPCHSIGQGVKVGPDLAGVTRTRDHDWLARFIVAPAKMVADGDPAAVALFEKYKPLQMPNLDLSAADAKAIIQYMTTESDALPGAAATTGAPTGADDAPQTKAASAASPAVDLRPMIPPYLAIQQALSADTLDGVVAAAGAISTAIPRVNTPAEFILSPALVLQRTADIASARVAFGKLSHAMLALARDAKTPLGDVKVAYCPMARKYWLQKGTDIRNPYYGKNMLECGRIVESIPESLQ